jgi:plasmid stabilization system protein ParE
MTDYQIRILPRAIQDLEAITSWIHAHSPRGALALVLAFEAAVTRLKRSPEAYSLAPESDHCGMPLRQVFFRTRKGNTYRMVILIRDQEVQILRIRGSGQPPLFPDELASGET